MKRLFDIVVSVIALVVASPLIAAGAALVWLEDRRGPFYLATRVGQNGRPFKMIKLRTMRVGSDRFKVHSTALNNPRLLAVSGLLRSLKLDELPQFWNVLRGDMSFVGPRPNVVPEVQMYTDAERELLAVRPGITDYASIVFADLAHILAGSPNANRLYNRSVRPWKSMFGLHYVRTRTLRVDLALIALTALSATAPQLARRGVAALLESTGAAPELVSVAQRSSPLPETPPPGATVDTWESAITYRE